MILGKKVNFEQDQLWEKEEKSASRSGWKKKGRKWRRRVLYQEGSKFGTSIFLIICFSFVVRFDTALFLCVFVFFIIRNRDLWVQFSCGYTFITPMGCCHFQPESSAFLFSEIRNLTRFVYIKRFQPTIQFS